jgi:arylsulfatase A-like enzyme
VISVGSPRALRALAFLVLLLAAAPAARAARYPHVVLVTVDTLRADRLSCYGYPRQTTPNIDRLLGKGVRFADAYTVEPLTNPSLVSLLTSRYPHEHGATRNGLPIRPNLPSFPSLLGRGAFATGAFVGNWTLLDRLSGLGAHFADYTEVMSRKRWLVMKSEATAEDLTTSALDWVEQTHEDQPHKPLLLWVHYVEPHAPYRLQPGFASRLGYRHSELSESQRYDTEVAFVDAAIGELLAGVRRTIGSDELLVIFAGDHGESFGRFGYWGHGRHLFEDGLRIPLGIVWEGKLRPQVVRATASVVDVAPTVMGLLGYPTIPGAQGFDWTPVLRGQAAPPSRPAFFQAHKGAVQSVEDLTRARRRGLLEIGMLRDGRKETLRLRSGERLVIDVRRDPGDARNLVDARSAPSAELLRWRELVEKGLVSADHLPVAAVDAETDEALRSLGYIDE